MTMAAVLQRPPGSVRLEPSFSLYVTPSNVARLKTAARFGDAMTVAGPKGPETIRRLRQQGLEVPVLFDGMGYSGNDLSPEPWVALQRTADADRVMLPGKFVAWDKTDTTVIASTVLQQDRIAMDLDSTSVIALDARWIARRPADLLSVLACD